MKKIQSKAGELILVQVPKEAQEMTKNEVSNLIKSLEKRRMKAFRYHDDKTYNVLTNRLNLAHDEYFELISTTKQVDQKLKHEEEFRQKTSGHFNWELFLGKVNKKQ